MARRMLHPGGRVALCFCLVLVGCTDVKNSSLSSKGRSRDADAATDPKPPSPGDICDAGNDTPGDCKKKVCAADGGVTFENDDKDVPKSTSCQRLTCSAGEIQATDLADGTTCNSDGTCKAGRCVECEEGGDCTRNADCEIYKTKCINGKPSCEPTGMPRDGMRCQSGKVCSGGSCVPCVVGAECEIGDPCYLGRVKSCDNGLECEPQPQSGMSCGTDEAGKTKYCVSGLCTIPCREGPCMTASGQCMTSHWDCAKSDSAPSCLSVPIADGTLCDAGTCRGGTCTATALTNGDFSKGLAGWTAMGDAAKFQLAPNPDNHDRITLSTRSDAGVTAKGSLSQTFTVPADALALRFYVSGGQAHVRLKDASGIAVEDCTGISQDGLAIPVSWDLTARRGMTLTIAIEDDVDTAQWGYVSTSGFDVIRDVSMPLRNSQWSNDFAGWETSGDGQNWNLFVDGNYWTGQSLMPEAQYGERKSLSSYARSQTAAAYGTASLGTVSQMFVVPMDAVALRFNVHGGSAAVILYANGEQVATISANNDDYRKIPVNWDLTPYRGMTVKLSIEDNTTLAIWGYIGVSGFDVITSYNGP